MADRMGMVSLGLRGLQPPHQGSDGRGWLGRHGVAWGGMGWVDGHGVPEWGWGGWMGKGLWVGHRAAEWTQGGTRRPWERWTGPGAAQRAEKPRHSPGASHPPGSHRARAGP